MQRGELPAATDLARAKDFLMAWPFYLLITDRLPQLSEVPRLVEESLGGLTGR